MRGTLAVALLLLPCLAGAAEVRVLDDGSDPAAWSAVPSEGVTLAISADRGTTGPGLRLDYDFHGGGGWAAARRDLDLELPQLFRLSFWLRGAGPANTLEVKLVSGDNVWWARRVEVEAPAEWTRLAFKRRHFSFAWGPHPETPLGRVDRVELAIVPGAGEAGTLWLDELELEELPAPSPPREVVASASAGSPRAALDLDPTSAWQAPSGEQWLELDLGGSRELGGLVLDWRPGQHASDYAVDGSEDGISWTALAQLDGSNGGRDWVPLPETETRHLRLRLERAAGAGYALADLAIQPLDFAPTGNALWARVASAARRGTYPRALAGEQSYWTVVGVDRDHEEALVGEDGAVEAGSAGFTVEPFLLVDGRLLTWADAEVDHFLEQGDLPIPTVTWRLPELALAVTPLAHGEAGASVVTVRYRLVNPTTDPVAARLILAVRPFQVNPPAQFLGRPGGVAPIRRLELGPSALVVDGGEALRWWAPPAAAGCSTFAAGEVGERLAARDFPTASRVDDPWGYASAALAFDLAIEPGRTREVVVDLPLHSGPATHPVGDFDALLAATARGWRERLDGVRITLPGPAQDLVRTLRSNLAYVLVNRDGPAIQPGSRAYARSWIRDGALTSSALLRLGLGREAGEFAEWFAGFQYPSGKVPCCVDRRGADPVPEHDSHGELVFLIAEHARLTGDLSLARRLWPHVARAVAHLDELRFERLTDAYLAPEKRRYYGLLPESISHEGYSAHPVHSYWDDLWALKGFEDATWLAGALGLREDATRIAALSAAFRNNLQASIARTIAEAGIDYVPGSADLADLDPTSTTVALSPVGAEGILPERELRATFRKAVEEVRDRRDGTREWEAYTPYELRIVGALVRLGEREAAWELLRFYLADRRPAGWNAWAEVVGRDARKPRFVGDIPHTWVGSDFIRSFLDLLAFERDDQLVLAAGVPAEWLGEGERVAVEGLVTRYGRLSFELETVGGCVRVGVDVLASMPPDGVVVDLPAGRRALLRQLPAEEELCGSRD